MRFHFYKVVRLILLLLLIPGVLAFDALPIEQQSIDLNTSTSINLTYYFFNETPGDSDGLFNYTFRASEGIILTYVTSPDKLRVSLDPTMEYDSERLDVLVNATYGNMTLENGFKLNVIAPEPSNTVIEQKEPEGISSYDLAIRIAVVLIVFLTGLWVYGFVTRK